MNIPSVEKEIASTLKKLCEEYVADPPEVVLEIPRNKQFGDLSSNIAMIVAKKAGLSSRELAGKIAEGYPTSAETVEAVEIAGPGFLNFRLSSDYFRMLLSDIVKDPHHFGDSDEGSGQNWHFEFVSANPTGPLNIVSARAASIGDSLVRIFRKRGYDAHSEFYVNDGGGQVNKFGASIRTRMAQIKSGDKTADIPEGGYHGEYVVDIAAKWLSENPGLGPGTDSELGKWGAGKIRDDQEHVLRSFRVRFDRWFWESELYSADSVNQSLEELKSRDLTYHKDGALYFRAGDFGDSEDRVVMTSDGRYTYIVPDIAYHRDKRDRGFHKAVNLLGPDHHGHILQLNAALKALGMKDFFHPIIVQQVNLKRSGEEVKMSKRAGVGIILEELVEEVGVDAARFFFLMRKTSSPLTFDIDLAKSHSEENPVYYVQYAHARICSILRQPQAGELPAKDIVSDDLTLLKEDEELNLVRAVARFPWTLSAIVRSLEPLLMTTYLTDLAKSFHYFYTKHRVITDDLALTSARLTLCRGVAGVLKEGLRVIGVEAPERM